MMQGKYEDALKYMQKANLLSEKKITELHVQFSGIQFYEFLNHIVQIKQSKQFMNIYAGRKYQLANIIYKYCQKQQLEQSIKFYEVSFLNNTDHNGFIKNYQQQNNQETQFSNYLSSEHNEENNNNSLNLHTSSAILKRSYFYSNKFYLKQKHGHNYNKFNNQTIIQTCQFQENKALLTQAIDLLQEASFVYQEFYLRTESNLQKVY
ncbi:hypothetical protein TTHERM_000147669 (macronuclear) [Tetrahymena thermophila SB210]|uniref:Tetratricopeptide repeat protein n=1 Tax=Tetrahymena thermophila (strain SB210) TaxID=312017 RepID=W7X6H2_TETTS|nr:hypothetical protein TTHERM_000147669 [Tetrahymena thermophila SB210]EWS73012.1 hypothetical protein TTHERM_000147669 [Tetrahymena thermophila SB210]|eukprot:XP_012654409.1 hypothetical protein TTHERM_000147669 [Tetrahymena thermophila SB210]